MSLRFTLSLFLVCFLIKTEAMAAAITNLSNEPKNIAFQADGVWQEVTIEAQQTWRMSGDVRVKFLNRELVIGANIEYAIWPDGAFGPQRIFRNKGGFQ